ncbi:hypothetical protein LNQ36_16230, partial [Yersinia ruckeri]|nr:hypothetical protein [Yersinia ruckeri]MCK8563128.1 hypothetical protein [Yersinia ruckeri]MCK8599732.1 hypothetical protein [Yersinia ruckeri]
NSRPRPWQGRALPTELFPLYILNPSSPVSEILHRYGVRIIREIRFAASPWPQKIHFLIQVLIKSAMCAFCQRQETNNTPTITICFLHIAKCRG